MTTKQMDVFGAPTPSGAGRPANGYTLTSIVLHWAIAGLIFSGAALGAYMVRLSISPAKLRFFSYHKWIGVTIFLVAVVRLLWRATHPAPELPPSLPRWERMAAKAGHLALYALIFMVPVSGWLTSSAHGFQTVYFGVLPLPDILEKNKELAGRLETVHFALNKTLLILAFMHAGAAFKHHFIDRDDVLKRMLKPGKWMLILALLAGPAGLSAAPLNDEIARGTSNIDFTAFQLGAPLRGSFTRFDADVRLNEKYPEKSRAKIIVYIDGIDAGADDATIEVKRKTWFDAVNYPKAEFVSTSVNALGNDKYRVAGKLTIKGRTRDVAAPVSAARLKDAWLIEGRFIVKRLDFNIGEGAWAGTDTVADEVEVSFKLHVLDAKTNKRGREE
ncbi:MAG: cytochrome b/b6 domain-containing protein [Deltaproteobacteria bacterium]|nr:cytochrome b/b6 domain-containing protein [Deltaproteobacteria bacterium]